MGSLQTYDLVCELFQYSNEKFNTGIEDIDAMYQRRSSAMSLNGLKTEDSNPFYITDEKGYKIILQNYDLEVNDPSSENDEIQQEANNFIDFSEIDPFSEGKI
jgi:hypothetical protein